MITQGASLYAIILGTFFINLRHVVMSSSVMQRLKGTTLLQRLVGAFALCDESFAIYSLSNDHSYYFLLGSNTALYVSFVLSTLIGTLMTGLLPKIVIDSFGIAIYAAFLGLLLPSARKSIQLVILVVMTALVNWLLQSFIPKSWSVILAMILGAFLGVFLVDDDVVSTEPKETKEIQGT